MPPTALAPNLSSPPPRRILAIWLGHLAIDRWRLAEGCLAGQGPDAGPLALVTETQHGPKITALNRTGMAAGARLGMMLADARAICAHIAVYPADHAADRRFLEQLALWAQRWGPWSAIDPPDGLLIDVTGVAHLFGGEDALLAEVATACADRKLEARAAIAPTAGAAWALAHHGPDAAILPPEADPAAALAQLPTAALRLDGDVLVLLRRLGIRRIGDLTGIARKGLARRFRKRVPTRNPLLRHDQLIGLLPEPAIPAVAHIPAMVQRRLMEPIRHRALLDQVLDDLAADLVRELERRGEGARRLELHAWKVDGAVIARRLELAAATRDATHLVRLLASRLDDIDAGFGIELVRLCAAWAEPLAAVQSDIEANAPNPGTTLAAFVDRLAVRLGADAVQRPVAFASHVPERAQRWQPPLAEPAGPAEPRLPPYRRPLKLLDRAEPIAVTHATPEGLPQTFRWRGQLHAVARAEGPERIAPEWWRERSTTRLRDYYRIEDDTGRRYWIYRYGVEGDGRGGTPEWYLHGLFG